jgi:ankyrin repeat protein
MKMRAVDETANARTRRWFVWIVIGWLSTATLIAMLLFRAVGPDLPPELSVQEGNNPGFDAVLARDARKLIDISDELEPQWLDEVHRGMTPIIQAASFGDVEMVESLIRAGADSRKRGAAQRTALQYAAEKGHPQPAVVLLDAGVEVDGADVSGLTPLIMAAGRDVTELAFVLMDAGANVNAVMNVGWTPLLDAARRGNLALAKELLRRGADVNTQINNNSAVRLAEDNGHSELAQEFRAAGGRR